MGAVIIVVFLVGLVAGNVLSRKSEDAQTSQSHADKLNYPADENQESSISALARAHVALAKDADTANKGQASRDTRAHRVSLWTAIGVGAYTVFTAAIVVLAVIQYGESHRFNRKQMGALNEQLAEMRAERRAWIAPGQLEPNFLGNMADGAEITFRYENVGRDPAVKINAKIVPNVIITYDQFRSPTATDALIRRIGVRDCMSIPLDPNGSAAFPHQNLGLTLRFDQTQTEKIKTRDHQYAFIAGCVVYETMNEIHWSEVCEILAPVTDSATGWVTNTCFTHTSAK